MIKVYYLYSTEFGSDLCNMRYIGQTKQSIEKRLKCHIQWSFTKRYNSYVYNWIRSVYAKGFEVKIGLLVDDCIWNITEIEQIKKYKDLGYKLTNLTDGGEGCLNLSNEVRERKSKSMMGKNKGKNVLMRLKRNSKKE